MWTRMAAAILGCDLTITVQSQSRHVVRQPIPNLTSWANLWRYPWLVKGNNINSLSMVVKGTHLFLLTTIPTMSNKAGVMDNLYLKRLLLTCCLSTLWIFNRQLPYRESPERLFAFFCEATRVQFGKLLSSPGQETPLLRLHIISKTARVVSTISSRLLRMGCSRKGSGPKWSTRLRSC